MARKASTQEKEFILPFQGEACPFHPKEELYLFCDSCMVSMCIECAFGEHEGHPQNLAGRRMTEMMEDFKRVHTRLQNRRQEEAKLMTKEKKKRGEIDAEYQRALKALKQKYQVDVGQSDAAVDQADHECRRLDLLDQGASSITPSSKVSVVLKMKSKMTDALGETVSGSSSAPVEELRDACKKLLPDTSRAAKGAFNECDVAVPLTFYEDCRNFGQASTKTPPSVPQWPPQQQVLKWEDNDDTDVALIPPVAAQQLLHLAGGQVDLTLGDVNGRASLVAPDGQERYLCAGVYEGRGLDNDIGVWFLPCSAALEDSVTAATGRRPRAITGYDDEVQYDLRMTCLEWGKKYYSCNLYCTF